MASISFSNINKSFGGTRVLNDLSLSVTDGEFIALVGPSGCGKTTLLRILAGLESQDDGEVLIGDRVIDELPPKERDIAMVFQSYALYPYMSVRENISLPLIMRRLTALQRMPMIGRFIGDSATQRQRIEQEAVAVAQSLQIDHLMGRKPGQLSGGQRQRVALARAMVRKPAAFLMDEPLSNLDAKLRVQARAEIADLHRRIGATFVYVTHDQVEAMTMADRVAVMMGGNLLQVATPEKIYADPSDIRVAEFIGAPSINIIPGWIGAGGQVETTHQVLPINAHLEQGSRVNIGIRPEVIRVVDKGGTPVVVRHVEHLGADIYVYAEAEQLEKRLVFRLPTENNHGVRVGIALRLDLATPKAFLFGIDGKRVHASIPAHAPVRELERQH